MEKEMQEEEQNKNVDLENRVRQGTSTVTDSAELPYGGSSGGKSGNVSLGIGGEHRETLFEEQAEKLQPQSKAQQEVEKVDEKVEMTGAREDRQAAVDPSSARSQ